MPDRMAASVSWSSPADAEEPQLEELTEAIARAGLVGIATEVIEDAFDATVTKKIEVQIAEGRLPSLGEDGQIEWLIDLKEEGLLPGAMDEHGKTHFFEQRRFVKVSIGTLIARWKPPVPAVSGVNVLGEVLVGAEVAENGIVAGKNVRLSGDKCEATSALDGHVFVSDRSVSVDRLFRVNGNVNFKVGNVRFPGNVEVSGDVEPGFVIEAEGNVIIGGLVETAEVRATGDIVVRGGILNHSRVMAGTNLEARFIQDSYVECDGSLTVADSVMQSVVANCRKFKLTGQSKPKGIVGGTLNSLGNVTTYGLGSELGVKTVVNVGTNSEYLMQLRRLEAQVVQLRSHLEKLARLSELVHGAEESEDARRRERIEKLERTEAEQRRALAKATEDLDKFRGASAPFALAVVVGGIAYENVYLTFGDMTLMLKERVSAARFYLDQETLEVAYASAVGKSGP